MQKVLKTQENVAPILEQYAPPPKKKTQILNINDEKA
jgi:hypothetical protein